jgi:hypothetical protein
VLLAVQLDHELRCVAVEIDDTAIDRNLAAELRALEA